MKDRHITVRCILLGVLVCGLFAILTSFFSNRMETDLTSTQIPLLPYVLLLATILLINPLCRLVRFIRPFTTAEILLVFIMGMVTAGISLYGLSAQLVPIAGSLFNRAWNNDQSKWNETIVPYVNEKFFVAEDGIQAAAATHLGHLRATEEARRRYRAALALSAAETDLSAARQALAAAASAPGDAGDRLQAIARARDGLLPAEGALADVLRRWEETRLRNPAVTVESVLRTEPERIAREEADTARARAELAALEEKAFAKVALFRRGLPKDQRAFPGILPLLGEGAATYFVRVQCMVHGRRSGASLDRFLRELPARPAAELKPFLTQAADTLEPLTGNAALLVRQQELEARQARAAERLAALRAEGEALADKRRSAAGEEMGRIDRQIRALGRQQTALDAEQKRSRDRLERTSAGLAIVERVRGVVAGLRSLERDLGNMSIEDAHARGTQLATQYHLFDGTLKRFLIGDIPWSHWLKPLSLWLLLVGLVYTALMTFNVLIFRQWAHHERLTYPLAELTEQLAGALDTTAGRLPAIFKSGLFWTGAAISATVLSWNLLCHLQLLPGMKPFDLDGSWRTFIEKTPLEGLLPAARSTIFFTMIGLSFLVPKKISFSLWFFSVLYMVELLFLVRSGYGVNESSFPMDWWYTTNFRTGQGAGALLVFASVVLFKCRRYLLCCLTRKAIATLERDEQLELRLSSFLFLACSTGIVLMLWQGMGANLWYTLCYCVVILLITVGLVRAVTEGGVLGFQAYSGPFHFLRTLFGTGTGWTAPAFFAPLMVFHAVLFLDIKAFIAPAMANALKIRNDLRLQRFRFHLSIVLAIAVAVLVSLLSELMLSYSRGADEMEPWFYSSSPQSAGLGQIASLAGTPAPPSGFNSLWMGVGAAGMAALLFFRQICFWLPHPIGFIMLVNPMMTAYWFSILLGWLAKTLVTRYGSKDLYAQARSFFLGLIVGELVLVAVAMFCAARFGMQIPIDLDRKFW